MPDDPDAVARLFYLILLLLGLSTFFVIGTPQRLGATLRQLLTWALIFAMAIIAYGYRDTLRAAMFPGTAVLTAGGVAELRRARDGHFYARLEVNGAPISFMIDTGASDLVLGAGDARRAGLNPAALAFTGQAMTANGMVRTATVRLDRVEFAGLVDTDVRASVTSGALQTSLLGMGYLDRFARIEIAGDTMRLSR